MDRKVFVYQFPPSSELAEGHVECFECLEGNPFSAILVVLLELLKSYSVNLCECWH